MNKDKDVKKHFIFLTLATVAALLITSFFVGKLVYLRLGNFMAVKDYVLKIYRNNGYDLDYNDESQALVSITGFEDDSNQIYAPEEVEMEYTVEDLYGDSFYNFNGLPTKGDANMLVVPIVIPGYEEYATNEALEVIQNGFFGREHNGDESVSSFYYKSSYGQLNLGGAVLPWYKSFKFLNSNDIQSPSNIYEIVQEALHWFRIDTSKFDLNRDGYIDAIYVIYSAPTWKQEPALNSNYWAWTTSLLNVLPDDKHPGMNNLSFASIFFLQERKRAAESHVNVLIHETGHLLGLSDYYDTYYQSNPLGQCEIMDFGIGDLNAYSKMLLGWQKPYVVLGNGVVNLDSILTRNNFFVVLDDEYVPRFNAKGQLLFNPFSEYILGEHYKNVGLHRKPSMDGYDGVFDIDGQGIKLYHVDSRLFKLEESSVSDASTINEIDLTKNKYIRLVNNTSGGSKSERNILNRNDLSYENIDNAWNEILLIDATNQSNFIEGGHFVYATKEALFMEGDVFSIDSYNQKYYFPGTTSGGPNELVFNNGNKFSKTIAIDALL